MGTSQADKARSRDRILAVAGELFRRDGLAAVSVAGVMQSAGLTHGGFYKHFDDREQLVAEALRQALMSDGDPGRYRSYEQFVRGYVSRTHRDMRANGCPISALAGEVARADDKVRAVLAEGISGAVAHLAELMDADDQLAAAALSTAVGAVVLARAVDDPDVSDQILAGARRALRDLVNEPRGDSQ